MQLRRVANAPREGDDADWRNWRRTVYRFIKEAPFTLTKHDLTDKPGDHPGPRRRALRWIEEHGLATTDRRPGPNGERTADRYGPVFDFEPGGSGLDEWITAQDPATG